MPTPDSNPNEGKGGLGVGLFALKLRNPVYVNLPIGPYRTYKMQKCFTPELFRLLARPLGGV